MRFFRNIACAIALCVGMTACDLSENEADCLVEMRLDFRFERYGEDRFAAEVPSLSVFVFDANERFVGRFDENDATKFGPDYSMSIALLPGSYSLAVWGGLDDPAYYIGSSAVIGADQAIDPRVGVTSIEDMAVRLNYDYRAGYLAERYFIDRVPGALFFGDISDPVTLELDQSYRDTVDLTKYTNRIDIDVIGHPVVLDPNDTVDIQLHSSNGSYDFRGELAGNRLDVTYPQHNLKYITRNGEPVQTSTIYTVRPVLDQNDHTLLLFDELTGERIFSADVLDDYITRTVDDAGNYIYATQQALDEEDTYHITLEFDDGGGGDPDPGDPDDSHLGVKVTVNGWNVKLSNNDIE